MHACIHKVQLIHRRQGAKAPKKFAFCQGKDSVDLDFVLYLWLDVVHKVLHSLMKALYCITLSTCEALGRGGIAISLS